MAIKEPQWLGTKAVRLEERPKRIIIETLRRTFYGFRHLVKPLARGQ